MLPFYIQVGIVAVLGPLAILEYTGCLDAIVRPRRFRIRRQLRLAQRYGTIN